MKRIEEYSKIDLGLDYLNRNEEYIKCIKRNTESFSLITYDRAKELVLEGNAIVHSSDSIYMMVRQRKKSREVGYRKIREEAHHRCHYCGGYGETVDHKIPKSQGGTDSKTNVVCACRSCNHAKGNMPYEEFVRLINRYGIERIEENLKVQGRWNLEKKIEIFDVATLNQKFDEGLNISNQQIETKLTLDEMIATVLTRKKY
jgi:5-methylcytosine-specific restriction endonuclease McrA